MSVAPTPSRDVRLIIQGGRPLRGAVSTSGFKHSMVTSLAAAALGRGTLTLRNCPDIDETRALAQLLSAGGARVERASDSILVDGAGFEGRDMDGSLAGSIHGSVYLLPAILHRRGVARVPFTGGCRIGSDPGGVRPMAQYLEVLRRFGAATRVLLSGEIEATATALRGCEIDLLDFTSDRDLRTGPLYSGASKVALLCAAVAEGVTRLHHLYPKPDVTDLVDTLAALGAQVEPSPDGSVTIRGRGGDDLTGDAERTLLPDLIEVVTWITAGATLADAPLRISGAGMDRTVRALGPELDVLGAMGVRVEPGDDHVVAHPAERLRPVEVIVASCWVYSDAQPLLALLACRAAGRTVITETVWASRFQYAAGLRALGAAVTAHGATLFVDGPCPPHRADRRLHAPDLRAASTLLLAALGVQGPTVLHGAEQLERGYGGFVDQLRGLGASVDQAD